MLTQTVLTDLREHLMNRITYAQYDANGITEQAQIESKAILDDGYISISFIIGAAVGDGESVTEVRLYDANDVLLASKSENIIRNVSMGGTYYRFLFMIEEVMDDATQRRR